MKIVILSDDFPPISFGGAGIAVYNLAKALKKEGNSVFILTVVQKKEDEGDIEYDGLIVHKIYSNYHERWRAYLSLYNPETVKKVKRAIFDFKPDVVHAHNIHKYLSYHSLKIAKQSGAKVFLTAHDMMLFHYGKLVEFINPNELPCPKGFNYKVSPWQQIRRYKKRYNPFRNIIIRYYLKYVDKIFAVSNAIKEALNQNGINNVEVIYNGINTVDWQVDVYLVEKFRDDYNLQNKNVVLFGGRLSELKGGRQIIKAMEKVVRKLSGAVLLVMGEKGEYSHKMIKIAHDAGIEKNLIFTGWISGVDLRSAYNASEIVVMPSIYYEPFGLVCLEAMACKKPVIASCFGGGKEIVVENETGYTLNPFDTLLMADRILDLLTDSSKSQKFGNAGFQRVQTEFDLEKIAQQTVEVYKKFFNT